MKNKLIIKNLIKDYTTDNHTINDISMNFNEGELISIIGPSGAGKSTILRTINRLIDPTSGSIIFNQKDILKLNNKELRKWRTDVGMVFQHANLVDKLSVFENILHGLCGNKSLFKTIFKLYNEDEKKEAIKIAKELSIDDILYKRCDEISGGQRQRVGIARSLIQKPKIILCDEPIASLDPISAINIMNILKEISKSGIICICNLHQVDIAKEYSDYIFGIKKGVLVFEGKSVELTNEKINKIYEK